jgi:hypothetical protein
MRKRVKTGKTFKANDSRKGKGGLTVEQRQEEEKLSPKNSKKSGD